MTDTRLRVLGVVEDAATAQLIEDVFSDQGDEIRTFTELAEAVTSAKTRPPNLVFVDVSMGQRAGLALIHHVKAVAEKAVVYALIQPDSMEAGAQALALGAAGLVLLPLGGDDLLTPAVDLRCRLAEQRELAQLKQRGGLSERIVHTGQRLLALATNPSLSEIAEPICSLFRDATEAKVTAIYVPAAQNSVELRRLHVQGELPQSIPFTDEMGLNRFAHNAGLDILPLQAGGLATGYVLIGGSDWLTYPAHREAVGLWASQTALLLALCDEKDRSGRATIKDPATSAYSFAYFVDVAGREIDKALRHERQFSLATVSLTEGSGSATSGDVAELLLGAVRDSDILARVDEQEFYLLLPETGGRGAHACRRRVLELARKGNPDRSVAPIENLAMGIASYPHDGENLSRLLRMAKRRAEESNCSAVHRLRLHRLGLEEMVDTLLWDVDIAHGNVSDAPETPRAIELPIADVISMIGSTLQFAEEGGETMVVGTQRDGIHLLSQVRGQNRDKLTLHTLDVAGKLDNSIEAVAVIASHGAYCLLGRVDHGIFHGVHAADPLLADLTIERLAATAGTRIVD